MSQAVFFPADDSDLAGRELDLTTGDQDQLANAIAAYLIPKSYTPQLWNMSRTTLSEALQRLDLGLPPVIAIVRRDGQAV